MPARLFNDPAAMNLISVLSIVMVHRDEVRASRLATRHVFAARTDVASCPSI